VDAFISYKSEDVDWAERLVSELGKLNVTVFFDKANLLAGGSWSAQLQQEIEGAGALIVLWSKRAAEFLSWTEQERNWFERLEVRTPRERKRPVVFVTLDAKPQILTAEHHLTDLEPGYPGGIQSISDAAWTALALKVKAAVLGNHRIVHTLVLAAKVGDLEQAALGAGRFNELAQRVEALGIANFSARYGQTAREWKPHGVNTIAQMLSDIQADLVAEDLPLRFEDADQDFFGKSPRQWSQAARTLSRQPALIIVDPFSLYDLQLERLLESLGDCFRSRVNAIAALSPHPADDVVVNDQLRAQAGSLFKLFFRPIPFDDNRVNVGLNLRNRDEVTRVLLMALSRHGRSPEADRPHNPITGGWGS
jgi:TIR domain